MSTICSITLIGAGRYSCEIDKGVYIGHAAAEVLALARERNAEILFTFNGRQLEAKPGYTIADIDSQWDAQEMSREDVGGTKPMPLDQDKLRAAILARAALETEEKIAKFRAQQYNRDEFMNRQIDSVQRAAMQYRMELDKARAELRRLQSKPQQPSTPLVPLKYKRAIQIEGETTCNEPQ